MAITLRTHALPQDANGHDIQAPSKWVAQDATGTPNKSPLTVSSTEIDIIVPEDAVTMVLSPVGADLRVAVADGGTAAAPYRVIKDGTTVPIPVANVSGTGAAGVFLLRDASTNVTLHFHFEMIGS